jgi:hypothetical protein
MEGAQPGATKPRRLLATSVTYALALVVAALALWFLAIAASWEGKCPPGPRTGGEGRVPAPTGLDKGVYVWPPGAQCYTVRGIANYQAWPWAPWSILALFAGAGGTLLFGIVVTLRDLKPPTAPAPRI